MTPTLSISIVSWNIGDNMKKDKIQELQDKLENKEIDVIFLCLQEYNGRNDSILNNIFNYRVINIGNVGNSLLKFQVSIFAIIRREELAINFNLHKKEYNTLRTKSFIIADINIKNKETFQEVNIVLINSHFPFNDDTKKWHSQLDDIMEILKDVGTNNIFICGDLNSRSLLTKECYRKNVSESKMFNRVNKLLSKYNVDTPPTNIKIDIKPLECIPGVGVVNENKYMRKCMSNKENTNECKSDLIRFLLSVDFLKEKLNSGNMLGDYTEGLIKFLPSYKFDSYGNYSLKKGKKLRLPGYADRILYKKKSDIQIVEYDTLSIKGNDHIPVYGLFNIRLLENPNIYVLGGYIPKRKKTYKKRIKRVSKNKSKKKVNKITDFGCCIFDQVHIDKI